MTIIIYILLVRVMKFTNERFLLLKNLDCHFSVSIFLFSIEFPFFISIEVEYMAIRFYFFFLLRLISSLVSSNKKKKNPIQLHAFELFDVTFGQLDRSKKNYSVALRPCTCLLTFDTFEKIVECRANSPMSVPL